MHGGHATRPAHARPPGISDAAEISRLSLQIHNLHACRWAPPPLTSAVAPAPMPHDAMNTLHRGSWARLPVTARALVHPRCHHARPFTQTANSYARKPSTRITRGHECQSTMRRLAVRRWPRGAAAPRGGRYGQASGQLPPGTAAAAAAVPSRYGRQSSRAAAVRPAQTRSHEYKG